ncbi:MAG TPA: glycosyltransferase family 2 protein [Thermodesulfobacteriota bacterium]|nr:glycosyltransferase family 2 protein [Thermodesulfobacteriota bacterium]
MGLHTIVLIPVYNEGRRIGQVIEEIRSMLPQVDVLVIDDGSTDDGRQRAMEAGAKVISHPFNLGYGSALQTGYKYVLKKGYETVVQMDGDGQHDPSFISDLLAVVQRGEADIAIGSRFLKKEEGGGSGPCYQVPFTRRLGMKLFGEITSLLIRQQVTDSTSGYQAMDRRVLEWVSGDKFPVDYPDADVIIMLYRAGFQIKEVPVRMVESPGKKSMHSGWKPLYYVFKMFLSILVTLMRK